MNKTNLWLCSNRIAIEFYVGLITSLTSFRVVKLVALVPLVSGALFTVSPARADPSAARGKAFAQANCSQCHSIDKFTRSSLGIAPPFRTLHLRYPVESLEEALGEGIVTGHQNMPEFQLDPGQVGDFVKFLKSLE